MKLFLGLTSFLVSGDIPIPSPIYTFKYASRTFNKIELIAESTLKLVNDARSRIFGNAIFKMKAVF